MPNFTLLHLPNFRWKGWKVFASCINNIIDYKAIFELSPPYHLLQSWKLVISSVKYLIDGVNEQQKIFIETTKTFLDWRTRNHLTGPVFSRDLRNLVCKHYLQKWIWKLIIHRWKQTLNCIFSVIHEAWEIWGFKAEIRRYFKNGSSEMYPHGGTGAFTRDCTTLYPQVCPGAVQQGEE